LFPLLGKAWLRHSIAEDDPLTGVSGR